MMNKHKITLEGEDYTKAYDMHYKTKDLPKAFNLYRGVIADYPNTDEARYSLSQVQNIVNTVVPKHEVMDALVAMTLAHFKQDKEMDAESGSDASLAM